jgi:hypothetical protein
MNEQVIVGEAIAGRSATVRNTLKSLSKDVAGSTFDLAELLYEAQENNYLNQWGFPNIKTYAEQELGLKPRKARYLARIVKVYKEVGLERSQVEKVDISKLREITRLNPHATFWNKEQKKNEPLEDHIVRLILEAEDMTTFAIKEEVARLMGQVGPDRRVIRNYSTNQSAWDNVIKPALELCRKELGSAGRDDAGNAVDYHDGVCIESICADYLADPRHQELMELPEEQTENVPIELPKEIIQI